MSDFKSSLISTFLPRPGTRRRIDSDWQITGSFFASSAQLASPRVERSCSGLHFKFRAYSPSKTCQKKCAINCQGNFTWFIAIWKNWPSPPQNDMFRRGVKQIAHNACFLLFSYRRQTRQCVFHSWTQSKTLAYSSSLSTEQVVDNQFSSIIAGGIFQLLPNNKIIIGKILIDRR